MAKSKAARQRKKVVLSTPSMKTTSQPENNKAGILNNAKVRGSKKLAQKLVSRTATKNTSELPKTNQKASGSKQNPSPGKVKLLPKLPITPDPAIASPSTTNGYSKLRF